MIKKPSDNVKDFLPIFPLLYGNQTEGQEERYEKLFSTFKESFGYEKAYFASSSGRVEVIGNHTDHNGGKVVTCAISLDTLGCFMPTDNDIITIKSQGYDDIVIDIKGNEIENKGTSSAMVRGVVVGLKNKGFNVGGFSACFTSNVLGGAGISSSASFEVLVAEILNFLYNESKITAEDKAKVAKFSENEYFGKPCGLLDQSAIAFGGLHKFDFFNPNKIAAEKINNSLSDYDLVLINTGGSHADLTDEYAAVPAEMFSVAKALGIKKLADISKDEFFNNVGKLKKLSDRAILRAVHFYNENERVDGVVEALNNSDYNTFLTMVRESGLSSLTKLQNCSVAGAKEQPIVKALALSEEYLNGGVNRVHGGGFAGTILNVVRKDKSKEFVANMKKLFSEESVILLSVRQVGAIVL